MTSNLDIYAAQRLSILVVLVVALYLPAPDLLDGPPLATLRVAQTVEAPTSQPVLPR